MQGTITELSSRAVQEAVTATALRIERAVCAARIAFFSAILFRFAVLSSTNLTAVVITSVPLLLAIAFSGWVLLRVRRAPKGRWLWIASVALDALAVFCALLPNVMWPTPEYPGILLLPDTAGALVAVAGAGLRLSTPAAVLGGLLNGAGIIALTRIDAVVSGNRFATGAGSLSSHLLWVLGTCVVAVIFARTTRTLAELSAAAATRVDRAERGLWVVLADHHDLRSRLTSALFHANAIGNQVEGAAAVLHLSESADCLKADLAALEKAVRGIKQRALHGLDGNVEPMSVDAGDVAKRTVERAALTSPFVSLHLVRPANPVWAMVAGGGPGLERMLDNLLINACEGNRMGRATHVTVRVLPIVERREVHIRVEDDGPGMSVDAESGVATGIKPGSSGVGLAVVRALAESSGGALRAGPRAPQGWAFTVELIAADESRPLDA